MIENTSQKVSGIPLFDFTNMARGIASIQRNQPFIGVAIDEVKPSILAVPAFNIALDKKVPGRGRADSPNRGRTFPRTRRGLIRCN